MLVSGGRCLVAIDTLLGNMWPEKEQFQHKARTGKWTRPVMEKVMLRPSEAEFNHLSHGLWKDTPVGFIRPKRPSTAQVPCGNLHRTWVKVSSAS